MSNTTTTTTTRPAGPYRAVSDEHGARIIGPAGPLALTDVAGRLNGLEAALTASLLRIGDALDLLRRDAITQAQRRLESLPRSTEAAALVAALRALEMANWLGDGSPEADAAVTTAADAVAQAWRAWERGDG